jgi:sarcosine oxidase
MTFRAELRSHEPVPARVRPLQLGRRPAPYVAQAESHAWRSAHAGIAVNHYMRCAGPFLNELLDCARVICREKNIRRLAALDDVVEMQPENRDKAIGDARGLRVRIRDRNADFPLAGLVTLGILTGEDDKLRDRTNHTNHITTIAAQRPTSARLPVMNDQRQYDAIVVGLGAMGSATLCHLALGGWRVLGLEQFSVGHSLGSSHGDSRIIRETYFEHPLYVPLVQRAHQLWRELEERSGTSLMIINGGIMIGPADGVVVQGSLRSAAAHNLPHELLTPKATRERFPAFRLGDDLVAVLDPRAGYLDPEACNRAHVSVARELWAEVRFDEPALAWMPEGAGVRVTTASGSYLASRLVIAGGGWNVELLPDLRLPLTVERQSVFWLEPEGEKELYDSARFPIYAYEYKPGNICYGFPRLPRGVKASVMHSGETSQHPDGVRRTIETGEDEPLRAALRPILPALARGAILESGVCIFTNTPDYDFIVDFHPDYPQVLISSACSGHGFKFASALGEAQADLLITGRAKLDLSAFRLNRWSGVNTHREVT